MRAPRLLPWVVCVGLVPGIGGSARAQDSARAEPRFDERIGLPQNTAFDVVQDHLAFLWIGTNDGLTRYDGETFEVFRHRRDDAASLSHNTVRRVLEDRRHRLWVRTEAGLDRYVREHNQFRHYPVEAQQMFEDADGFIVASPAGLHRYDEAADRFETVVAFPLSAEAGSPSSEDPVWGLLRSRSGATWLTTEQGRLFGMSPDGARSQLQLPWRKAAILNEDPAGRLWIGHGAGMGVIDPAGPAVVPHAPFAAVRGPVIALSRAASAEATAGEDGRLWFGGAALYRTNAHGHAVASIDMGTGPLLAPIHAILHDREGLLWLATPRGLRFHNPYAKRWLASGGGAVMAVARGPGDRLWIGTLDRGVHGGLTGNVCPDQVWALLLDARHRMWVGSGHGLCVVEAGRARQVLLAQAPASEPVVFTLRQDRTGGIWAGTTMGLFRLDPRALTVRRHDAAGDGNIEAVVLARDGHLWVSTTRSELHRINPATLDTRRYPLGGSAEFRGSEGFWAITEVGDGRLWLGSDRGLFLFDPASSSFDAVDERHGVPVLPIYAILQDEQGSLWLSTRNGLLRHDNPLAAAPGARARHYTVDDGLPFSEFNRRAAMAGPDGWLTFGGMGGAVSFRPGDFRDNPHPPPVHVVSVERSRPDGPPERAQPVDDLVRLAAGDTGLVVRFTAPTFADAHRLHLQYRMEGLDAGWVAAGADRRARYPALRPGRYAFHVRAASADGVWSLDDAVITIVAPAPWWASWWFRSGAGLAGVILLVATLRWVLTRPLRRRVRALELDQRVRAERERISRDLHDHVGAQVTTLLAGIELAGLRAGRGEQGALPPVLADLGEEARRTIAQLRETVWSLRQDHISLRDLAAQVQEDLRNRQRMMARPRLTCDASGDLSIELGSEKALHLFRIVQESVTNAIRHANASAVHVDIASHAGSGIRVSVTDDGRFQPAAAEHQGTGLAGMRSRAADMGAAFSCLGAAVGTTIQVVVPPEPLT